MNCQEVRDRVLLFLDGRMPPDRAQEVRDHLAVCRECQKECFDYEKTWESLGIWAREEPPPGFVSRFWQRVARERPWYEKLSDGLRPVLWNRRAVALVTAGCLLVFVGTVTFRSIVRAFQVESVLTELNADEMELVDQLDLVENLDIVESLEFYEDWDYILDLKV